MTAASVAALTVYDMVKGVERGVEIGSVHLVSKTGGKSGEWIRPAGPDAPPPVRQPGDRSAGRINPSSHGRPKSSGKPKSPSRRPRGG
jgi:hypothetical protein